MDGRALAIKHKHPKDFLEISLFPKILSFKSFGNSWGNLCIHILVIIISSDSQIVLKSEKVGKIVDNLKSFYLRPQCAIYDAIVNYFLLQNSWKIISKSKDRKIWFLKLLLQNSY